MTELYSSGGGSSSKEDNELDLFEEENVTDINDEESCHGKMIQGQNEKKKDTASKEYCEAEMKE
jgi:hypothetical protein